LSRLEVFAPGKLLLIGEYAVLDGAPALVLAVDRRVGLSITPSATEHGCLNAPQLGIEGARIQIRHGELDFRGVSAGALGVTGRMIPAIVRALGRRPEALLRSDLEIDSSELFVSAAGRPVKLGLGSSAAVSAALAIGLSDWFQPGAAAQDAEALLRQWLPIYRGALTARASGADLAAAFAGGLTEFSNAGDVASCRRLRWPEDLCWRAVWTGQAAQTTDFVGRYEAWKRERPAAAKEIRQRLGQITQQATAGVTEAGVLVEACQAYADALVSLGEAMDMEIMSAPHLRLAAFARRCGVVYKSCGAGGGDLGVALATDPGRIRAFEKEVADHGGVPVNLDLSESGAGLVRQRSSATGANQ